MIYPSNISNTEDKNQWRNINISIDKAIKTKKHISLETSEQTYQFVMVYPYRT